MMPAIAAIAGRAEEHAEERLRRGHAAMLPEPVVKKNRKIRLVGWTPS
jgi:hypothetical protein